MKYFESLPKIQYNGYSVTNILTRVKLADVSSDQMAFLPYTVEEFDKPWTIAHDYYDSVDRTWLVYLSNDIIDPVYDWYLDTRSFEKYLKKKYGSIEAAQANLEGYKDADGTFYSTDTYTYSSNPDKSSWVPIYSYAREDEDNEKKKVIKLLDKRYAQLAEKNLLAALNG